MLVLSLVFVRNSRSQKSFVVLVALYEAKINMVILPYLSAILVFIQNLDELNRSQVMPREKQAIRVKQSESNNLGYNRKY